MAKFKLNFKKKIIPLLIAITIAFSVFSLSVFANEAVVPDEAEDVLSEKEISDGTSETSSQNDAYSETDALAQEGSDRDESEANFVSALLYDFKDNLPEILSALSLVCSIILMFVYKNGFIPMVKEGVSALSSKVKSISDEADKMASDGTCTMEALRAALATSEAKLESMESSLGKLCEELCCLKDLEAKTVASEQALTLEAEMLYELFMSSALPQYEKDRVGEKIAAIKLAIAEGGK